jgi:hypothetical protein
MTMNGLLVPAAYQEDESKCNVCLAIKALDEAHKQELLCLADLELLIYTEQLPSPSPVGVTCKLLQKFRESFHAAQTEYAVAFAVSLTLYHTVEKPELHRDAREALMAYQEYRARANQSDENLERSAVETLAHFNTKGWSETITNASVQLSLAHAETYDKTAAFWLLADKWTDDRHDKAFDFLDDLT